MANELIQTYLVLRPIDSMRDGQVLEAAPEDEPEERVTIWPCSPPNVPIGLHPVLATPIGHGTHDEQPFWVEDRPPGCLLSDLEAAPAPHDAARIASQIAEGLAALHHHGFAHGKVDAARVVLDDDGTPVLIGAGVRPGTTEADLIAMLALYVQLSPAHPKLQVSTMAELVAALREQTLNAPRNGNALSTLLAQSTIAPPEPYATITLSLHPLGITDEVRVELGPDETERGLLDRWATGEVSGDFTGDQTESIPTTELASQAKRLLLERVSELYASPELASRFDKHAGAHCTAISALLSDEPLDPLPTPEGVVFLQAASDSGPDLAAEITAEAPGIFEPHRTEETTGWTDAVENTSTTILSARWEWGLAGALVTLVILALLSLVIFYVFA